MITKCRKYMPTLLNFVLFLLYQAKQLALVGGTSLKEVTRRVISRLMKTEILTTYTYKGRRGKMAFVELQANQVIFKAIRLAMPNATDRDIESAIQSVLRYAADRQSGRSHKM